MNKKIILILCTFLLSINCKSYSSYELANKIRGDYDLNNYFLFDVDNVLNSDWLNKFKTVLEDLYSEDYRMPYLIFVNELDYSGVGENNFMSDFTERLISSNERKKKDYFVIILY